MFFKNSEEQHVHNDQNDLKSSNPYFGNLVPNTEDSPDRDVVGGLVDMYWS